MASRSEDNILRQVRDKLYVAVVSDVLDSLGFMNQAMSPRIRPLDEEKVLVGYARTGLYHDVYEVKDGENPYELEIALVDDLKPGEVPVLGCGATGRIAPWGELLSTASIGPLDTKGRGKLVEMDGRSRAAACGCGAAT